MGLEQAIDMLYGAGWSALDTTGCGFAPDGRPYPHHHRVRQELEASGITLRVSEAPGYGCFRAFWNGPGGAPAGLAVGATADEAAIQALAQTLRRVTQGV